MMRLQAIWTQIKLVVVFAWLYGWLAVVREPFWLVSSLLTPISIVVIMTVFGGLHYMYFGLLGGLAMAVSSSGGFTIIGDATYLRLELKFQSMLLNTRLNPVSYTLGLALSELTYALPGLAVFILLIQAMLREPASIYLLAISVLALEWIAASMLGFTLSTLLNDVRYGWSLSGILGFLLGTLPPVFYPAYLLPTPYIALVSPVSIASTVLQYLMLKVNYPSTLIRLGVLILLAEALVFTMIAFRKSRWRSVK
ncbi:MAG: ABC transporter permease [Caldivirga sp.]|uniref:ABC transporter permease n=1 Tax=Caldivirga sp. MU80 TaxID=1650354 RepID=UPI000A57B3AF|nr:ABC transporter permease [Caldivirga sp. MU80]